MLAGETGPTTIAFMVDSGASRHIVEHEWMLTNSRTIPEIGFKTVGSKLKANTAGDIMGTLPDGRGITFKDAVHVPDGGVNLLSEELLMERGWMKLVNDKGEAVLQHKVRSDWRLPLHKYGRARYLVVKLKKSPPTKTEVSKHIIAAAQPVKSGPLMGHKSDLAKPKAWKGRLVSWPNDRSGWGVRNPTTDRIVYSRDVTFKPPDEADNVTEDQSEDEASEVELQDC